MQIPHQFAKIALTIGVVLGIALVSGGNPVRLSFGTSPGIARLTSEGARNPAPPPLVFEANVGQANAAVQFQARTPTGILSFTKDEILMAFSQDGTEGGATGARRTGAVQRTIASVLLHFIGANPTAKLQAGQVLPGYVNYIHGNNAQQWHAGIPTYQSIAYAHLYHGIDVYYTGTNHELKGTYVLAPNSDPRQIRWSYDHTSALSIGPNGDLHIQVIDSSGCALSVIEYAPVAWQETDGIRKAVKVGYLINENRQVQFSVEKYDPGKPLIIDPALMYTSYLGGNDVDHGFGVTRDSTGNVYVTGDTLSSDFPTTTGTWQAGINGSTDVFVTKFDASGARIYSTYIGGSSDETGYDIAVNTSGEVFLTGETGSPDFPTAPTLPPPFQGTFGGGATDAFVIRLNAAGTGPIYSSYLGGMGDDSGASLAIDTSNRAYLTGKTTSSNFPLATPISNTLGGPQDAFVTRVNASGTSLEYSTYLGGTGGDQGAGIALDSAANVYVTGVTTSTNFPTVNPYQGTEAGGKDAFVSKLNSTGSAWTYATYVGGSGQDAGKAIAVDTSGNMYITGYTTSANFPTVNAYQSTLRGGQDAFLIKIRAAGTSLGYATYFGGSDIDEGRGIAVDGSGNAYLVGGTISADFPIINAIQPVPGGLADGFLAEFNIAGSAPTYATYLGGSGDDRSEDIVTDSANTAYVTGWTSSVDFPALASFQAINAGSTDAFIALIAGLTPVPPTRVAAPVVTDGGDQQAPRISGNLVVWEDNRTGNPAIRGANLQTRQVFTITDALADEQQPDVSGDQIIWQQRSGNGDWDIYGARILSGTIATSPTPIYVAPGDQIHPAVSGDIVVWQHSGQALATTTSEDTARWDIVGTNLQIPGSVFTLTNPTMTNQNPDVDGNTAVWQSAITSTMNWSIAGASNIGTGSPPTFVVSPTLNSQMYPAISAKHIVWQEYDSITSTWKIPFYDLTHSTMTLVASGLSNDPRPKIGGFQVVYQNENFAVGDRPLPRGWWETHGATVLTQTIISTLLRTNLTAEPFPVISGDHYAWQEITSDNLDIYANSGFDFSDVHLGDYFYAPVQYLASEHVISGYNDGTFRPYNTTTRGQLAKIVRRGFGIPVVTPTSDYTFADVMPDSVFYVDIETAAANGIVSGYPCGGANESCDSRHRPYYRPGNFVTRGQVAKIVVNSAGWTLLNPPTDTFEDVPTTNTFYTYIETAVAHHIINGYDCGSPGEPCDTAHRPYYRPGNNVTRGQITKLMYLALPVSGVGLTPTP